VGRSVTRIKALQIGVGLVVVAATTLVIGGSASGGPAPVGGAPVAQAPGVCDRNLGTVAHGKVKGPECTASSTADLFPELIWQGRIHLGDEPGIYGDVPFSGLATEFPITLLRTSSPGEDRTTLVVETEDVQTFEGYPGHAITVFLYVPDPTQPFHANQIVLARARLTSADNNRKEIRINLGNRPSPLYVSVQVRVDTEVPPAAMDDFRVVRLSNVSENFRCIASFGFISTAVD
jgi:hypothetical protein